MSNNAVTRISIASNGTDPLESVRTAIGLADAMVEIGATVTVTGDLSISVCFEATPEEETPSEPA